jgi:hypothetical protein
LVKTAGEAAHEAATTLITPEGYHAFWVPVMAQQLVWCEAKEVRLWLMVK